MTWFTTTDVEEFLTTAGAFLTAQPVENTLLLTVAETLRARGARVYGPDRPLSGWWTSPTGSVEGAFLHTPPYPVLLTDMPGDAVAALVKSYAGIDHRVTGVNATVEVARIFVGAWRRHTGASAELSRRTRLYRLTELREPGVPGTARVADPSDRDLLLDWLVAFGQDIDEELPNPAATIDDRISFGGLTLWEVEATPVAMGGTNRVVAGVARVGPVYTPVELRKRGYGGAVTAAVTRAVLAAGATSVVLFTDLANPTSNALYQRLGYHPVHDRMVFTFTA